VNKDKQHQSDRISNDMTLAAFDLFSCVKPTNPSTLSGFNALAVNNPGGWTCFAPFQFARARHKKMVDRQP